MTSLSGQHCVPSHAGMPALGQAEAASLLEQLPGWQVVEGPRLVRTWTFPDFASALAFVNLAGAIADEEHHHPDVALSWGRVRIELWTHAAGGLTTNDFILAARIDAAATR